MTRTLDALGARLFAGTTAIAAGIAAFLLTSANVAHASEPMPAPSGPAPLPDTLDGDGRGDGVYGRFAGPFALALGAGFEATPASGTARPNALASLRFYQSIGLGVSFAQGVTTSDPLERSLAASVLLEPLFLLRWSSDAESGRPFWDLALDSLSVSAGLVVVEPRGGSFGDRAGLRLGLGAGLPLLCRANGPWLRLGGRLETGLEPNVIGAFFAHLEWQWFFVSHKPE